MADQELVERFRQAFEKPDEIKAEEYQKTVEANTSKAAANAERLTFLLLILVMLFILVIQERIKKLDLGFVEIDDLSVILITLPVLVAYTHYDLVTTLSKFDRLSVLYKVIIEKRHPSIYDQRLTDYFLVTPSLYESKYLSARGGARTIQLSLWLFQFLSVTIFIPIGFQIMALRQLFMHPDLAHPALLVASITITIILSLQSCLTAFELLRSASES